MIGELLIATGQIVSRQTIVLDAIVFGTGPSFYQAICGPLPLSKRYGCGIVPEFLDVDVYALGDVIHLKHVPPDTPVYATRRIREAVPDARRFLSYPEDELPHGGSSGGMALSLACQAHDVVGLVGFDGYGMNDEFVIRFRDVIRFWQARGKRLVSLMPASVFHDLLQFDKEGCPSRTDW